jgi:demethylmenaquinone methyltransferase/2-methoxy-6-polyprenyl-1,4-benzoquinol methylase
MAKRPACGLPGPCAGGAPGGYRPLVRVVDLDRDMSDVIPTGMSRDSTFLFERMTEATLAATRPAPGRRVLDVASGFGQDAIALMATGAQVVGAEPSLRMTAFARLNSEKHEGPLPHWVRGWSDALPFADASFDAALCKGAIDHFDRPEHAIAEMARVTKPGGAVVLAIANFESLSCRVARLIDGVRERVLGRTPRRGRRAYDVPSDHFTRYDLALMRRQLESQLELEQVVGVSLAWGLPRWHQAIERLPEAWAARLLGAADRLARWLPRWADVVVLVGRPRPAPGPPVAEPRGRA